MFRPGTIDEFKAAVSSGKGFAKGNLFHVQLPSLGFADTKTVALLCTSVTLPARQLSTVQREMGIDVQNIAYGFVNPNVSMTFRVLNDQKIREYFEYWQGQVVQPYGAEGRYLVNYADNYMFPLHIYQLEKGISFPVKNKQFDKELGPININVDFDLDLEIAGKANYHWVLDRAYPLSIQYETLSDGAANQISEFTVEFTYKSWSSEKITKRGQVGATASIDVTTDLGSRIGNKIYDILG